MAAEKPGATGDFPEGKLNEHDEGGLRIAIGSQDGKVIIDFGKPVAWFGMGPQQARELGVTLMKNAYNLDEGNMIHTSGDVVCDICGDTYRHHPHDMKVLSHDGRPFLRVACDGRRMKL